MPRTGTSLPVFCTLFILLFTYTFAVKDYLFKKCDQNGFCSRNHHFANYVKNAGDNYQSKYSIDISSLNSGQNYLGGYLLKELVDGNFINLNFNITILNGDNFRFQLDEAERERNISNDVTVNGKRYNEASKWAFKDDNIQLQKLDYQVLNDEIIISYGVRNEYKAHINLYPFKITIFYLNDKVLIMNDRNLLNLEHYRTIQSENDENSVDVLLEESRFNAYNDNFKDSKNDKLPLGPESVALDFTFHNFTHVYGIPEHADSLSLKDTKDDDPYRLFNVDIFEYETQSKLPMYGSIPLMIGVSPKCSASIFWINAADTYIDINKISNDKVQTHWMSENGIVDVVLAIKPTTSDINKSYSLLTGTANLPNFFSIAYHQCRWNYNDEYDVLDVHSKFDESQIPYDSIWLDIEYTQDKKYFTWSKDLFPDPDYMMSKLDETGRHLVVIIDPHIKSNYEISNAIIENKIFIKDSNNLNAYFGHCWPGESIWIDTLNPKSQLFLNDQYKNGSDLLGFSTNGHLWNDMNEPSIFNGPETTAPKDLIHFDNWEHRSIHNLYGLTFHEATYEALVNRNPNQRPFILTRSFFAGSQRTVAMWTGDNMARWEYLKESIPMILTMNIVGFPFAGADVGGFFENPSKELLVRWYQSGIWYPFFRGHAHIDSRRREPYVAGDEFTLYMRDAIRLRYRLLGLLYTEFWKHNQMGTPVITPLVWKNSNDANVYEIDNSFYLGGLLVRPVTEENAKDVDIYLPCDGSYYDFFTFENVGSCKFINKKVELSDIPVFMKDGEIIPTKDRYRRSSKLMKFDPYTLYVVINDDGAAQGELYVDDGESFGYVDGDWLHVQFEADDKKRTVTGKVTNVPVGPFTDMLDNVTISKVIIVGSKHLNKVQTEATIENSHGESNKLEVISSDNHFIIRNPAISIKENWTIRY